MEASSLVRELLDALPGVSKAVGELGVHHRQVVELAEEVGLRGGHLGYPRVPRLHVLLEAGDVSLQRRDALPQRGGLAADAVEVG